MNCEQCLANLNDFVDDQLNGADSAAFVAHLEKCGACRTVHLDLVQILDCCEEVAAFAQTPPNPQALWLRISNLIECEQSPMVETSTAAVAPKTNWVSDLTKKSWRLSVSQMAATVAGVALITCLLTVVGIHNFAGNQNNLAIAPSNNWRSQTAKTTLENRWQQQQQAIDYWNHRVEARRNQWNSPLRAAFDRNLHEIDAVVADYKQQLQTNPNDQISEEMLDAAFNDKMELLREFSEL